MVADTDTVFKGVWANVAEYLLVDPETGDVITTYCADITTPTVDGFSYNMENIEDGTYYSDEQAAMIRTVAKNGYWGVIDDPETEEPEYGSLESVKKMMSEAVDEDGNAVFTEEEIASLTDGMAMTATQFAIWSFSNEMDEMAFVNAHYIKKDEELKSAGGLGQLSNIPEEERASVDLIFKLYDYLINMDPTNTENTTADTIINEDNFLKDVSLTVLEKADNHANNQDNNTENDAYITSLTFAQVVTPSDDNGDNLVVKVLDEDGNVLASGRIAGEAEEGETVLTPDENGNYSISGITMVEGGQNFEITLEGVQNLEEGVYLYTSEVEEGTSSQTLVGVASGERGVDVSMNIAFNLNVNDEIIVTERVWHDEGDPVYPPAPPADPVDPTPDPEEPVVHRLGVEEEPTVEIPEEEVPLANAPTTGDNTGLWAAVILMAAFALYAVNVFTKKRQHETF